MFAIVSNEVINIVSDYQYTDDIDEYVEILADEDFIVITNILTKFAT